MRKVTVDRNKEALVNDRERETTTIRECRKMKMQDVAMVIIRVVEMVKTKAMIKIRAGVMVKINNQL
jgi:hypothetical protein